MEDIVRELNTHDWRPEKGKTGILIIDLQEFFRGIAFPILEKIKSLLALAREKNIPLIFTQHGHESGEPQGMLGRWWSELIIKGTPESHLLPELEVRPSEIVIEKNRYSAFCGTKLAERLRESHLDSIIIGGVMTNLCCETTARDAFVQDFRVFFLADGTATASEEFQTASLVNLSYGFATLLTCAQLEEWLKEW